MTIDDRGLPDATLFYEQSVFDKVAKLIKDANDSGLRQVGYSPLLPNSVTDILVAKGFHISVVPDNERHIYTYRTWISW